MTLSMLCRDDAAWCPYCQKVWLQLEEKRIPYVIEKINMRCWPVQPFLERSALHHPSGHHTYRLACRNPSTGGKCSVKANSAGGC